MEKIIQLQFEGGISMSGFDDFLSATSLISTSAEAGTIEKRNAADSRKNFFILEIEFYGFVII